MKKIKEKEEAVFSFGFKLVSKRPAEDEITQLICTTDGHNKFYNIILKKLQTKPGYLVNAQYGRIGSTGTLTKPDYYLTESLAKYAIKQLVEVKQKKGYIFVPIKIDRRKIKKLKYV